MMQPKPKQHDRAAAWFVVIAMVAFLLRLVHILLLRHNDPLFLSPQMDALYHHQWALAVAAGKEFTNDAFFRAPLYPYFLGLLYKLIGPSQLGVRLVQAAVGSASCGLVYLLARRLLAEVGRVARPELVARASGFAMAAYPMVIYFDCELLIAGLLVFLLLLGFVLLLRSRDTDRLWFLPGVVFGLAVIARPNVLAFLAVLPVWLFLEYRARAWKRLLLVWGTAAVVVLPVTVRNYVVSRQFVPIAWQAGTNFYIGNSPESDGVTAILPGTRGSWWGGYNDVKRIAEQALGRPLKGAEIDRYWMGRGFGFWREQPGKALGLLARKTFLWFAGYEVGNDRDLYSIKRYSYISFLLFNSRFLKFPFGVLLPLALAGAYLARRQWRQWLPVYLFLVAFSASFIVFFVTSRYRVPLVPFAIVLAVSGVAQAVRLRGRKLTVPIVIAAGAFMLLNLSVAGAGRQANQAQNHFAVAAGLHEQGRDPEALVELRQALATDSATNLLSLEATILMGQGDMDAAMASAMAAARLHPAEADAWGIAGNVLATAGALDSAAACFRKALELDPYSLQAWNNLGNIALQRQDFAQARYFYEGALKISPTFTTAMFYLGLADYYQGNVEQAHARWRELLKLDPGFSKARLALEQLK
jgi:4-amino-4-deoxy-L-arabinose transferase-like glycosyltransferase/TolA-binding protein